MPDKFLAFALQYHPDNPSDLPDQSSLTPLIQAPLVADPKETKAHPPHYKNTPDLTKHYSHPELKKDSNY